MCGFEDEECEHCITCSYHNGCACEDDAKNLYNAGYRKSTDVARKIFEEIDAFIKRLDIEYGYFLRDMKKDYAELKKKYTEGER